LVTVFTTVTTLQQRETNRQEKHLSQLQREHDFYLAADQHNETVFKKYFDDMNELLMLMDGVVNSSEATTPTSLSTIRQSMPVKSFCDIHQ
ncbi:unnamed protein product, partial [Didymodactylos carnosus]